MEKRSLIFLIFRPLILLLFSVISVFAQENDNNGKWFFEQRAYPYDTLSITSYVNAIEYQKDLIDNLGYSISAPLQWTSIGPMPYNYNGVKAGRITCVQYYPNVPGYTQHPDWIYLTGHGGGVWRSTNGGTNFNPLTDELGCLTSGAIAFDPNNPNIIYYGTGGSVYNFVFNYGGIGVYKSTDAGLTWSGPFRQGFRRNFIQTFKIAVNPANSNHVYLACGTDPFYYPGEDGGGGLYKSTDGGITWAIAPETPPNSACNDVVIYYDSEVLTNRIYAAGMYNFGYYVSNNGGANFSKIENNGFIQGGRTHLSIPNPSSNIIYGVSVIQTGPPENLRGVYCFKSTNGGINFNRTNIKTGIGVNLSAAASFMSVNASPHDPQKVLVGFGEFFTNAGLYISTNGGNNFTSLSSIPGGDQNSVAFNPYGGYENEILVGDDQGLYKSTNLGTGFSSLNATLALTEGYRIAVSPDDQNYFLAVTDAGFFKRTSGTTWTDTDFGADGTQIVASKFNPNVFLGSKGCQCRDNDPWNSPHMRFTTNAATWGGRAISWGFWDGDQDWVAAITQYPLSTYPNTFLHPRRNKDLHDYIDINVTNDNGNVWVQNGNYAGIDVTPIYTQDPFAAPVQLVFVETNPNIVYVTTKSVTYGHLGLHASEIYRSTNRGESWQILNTIHNYLPDRVITSLATDPLPGKENILYCTLSGFASNSGGMPGHIFKSYNYGETWTDISTEPYDSWSLPDIPVNQIIVRRLSATQAQLIVATDAGVYEIKEGSSPAYLRWRPLATHLPNAVALGLNYNDVSKKLRVSTFGRGAFEVQLTGQVFVANQLDLVSSSNQIEISDDIVIGQGSTLRVPGSINVKLPAGKKIIIEDGGQIDVSSGAEVTFTSQSGEWGGIEFQDGAFGTLKNCTFENTSTPVVIEDQSGNSEFNEILIDNCNFNYPIEIVNRPNVTVSNCNFDYSTGTVPPVLGIVCSGSDDILITNNSITSGSAISSAGIFIVYGSDVVVQKNSINNMAIGISISNTSPFVFQNRITNSTASDAVVGIGFDNSYSATVKQNTVIGYQIGYKLYYSSPLMYEDSSYNTNTSGDSVNSLHAVYISNPRLKPDDDGGELIWDAGKNMLKTTAKGNGIYMYISSIPDIDYGYNEIYGYEYYLFGDGAPFVADHYSRCNDWVDDPPDSRMFNLSNPANIIYEPYGCTPPGGSGFSSDPLKDKDKDRDEPAEAEKMEENPPQNIIVNYGGGVYDTVKVTSRSFELSMDQQLYGQGVKEELLGNFGAAVTKYKSVIENYQDSTVSINAMKKILICHEKMNADTAAYDNLRIYYLNLIQSNPTDTAFVKAAKEQAIKTLVKKGSYSSAISQYEDIISSSSDPYEILCSELNIIETYMIMIQEGDAPGFTGRLANLKPLNPKDGHKMLLEKLYNLRSSQVISVVPKQFSLSQNYPNPFNPLTKINYSLPNSVKVTIVVYDILGRVIKSLVNEFKEAGAYSVTFDGTGLASGVYFYRIEAGDFVDSKKMVLVK